VVSSGCVRQQVTEIAEALRELHRGLIEAVRADYERSGTPVSGNVALFQLVVDDPFFAWLRPLSQVMVDVDELLDDGRTPSPEEAQAISNTIHRMISPSAGSEGAFWERYSPLLQADTRVVVAHARVKQALHKVRGSN
jgi:hypothetical protein